MFKDIITDGSNEVMKDDKAKFVKYKFNKHRLEKKLKKIRNFMKSKLFIGPRYTMAAIRVYSIIKQLFILEFELCNEVLIPVELRQD